MSATITWSFEGSSPCSWKSLLGEGSISLKDLSLLLNQWSDHWSCYNQCVDLQSSPSCSSLDVVFFVSCWNMNLIGEIHDLKIYRMVMNVIYCNLGINNLKSFDVGMIHDVTGVECHGKVCGYILCWLSEIIIKCFCGSCIYLCVAI